MKIILDAMGGDLAPKAPVLGAIEAVKTFGAEITLVGRSEEILQIMQEQGYQDLPQGIEIAGAEDVVDMHDDPGTVIHKRKNSSMIIGLRLLAEGQGDAFISAGSTGALLSGATLIVKRVKGIRRAAMGPAMPNKAGGQTLIVDCGANAECTPEGCLRQGAAEFCRQRGGPGCAPGGCGRGGMRRLLRKRSAEIHRGHRHVYGQPHEENV